MHPWRRRPGRVPVDLVDLLHHADRRVIRDLLADTAAHLAHSPYAADHRIVEHILGRLTVHVEQNRRDQGKVEPHWLR